MPDAVLARDARPSGLPPLLRPEADPLDKAIDAALDKGRRTADIKSDGTKLVGTTEMGDAIIAGMEKLAA